MALRAVKCEGCGDAVETNIPEGAKAKCLRCGGSMVADTTDHSSKPTKEAIRTFATGATRDTDEGKLDYEGFLSPLVLTCFAEYMHVNRVQSDGSLRASDNWQKGIPVEQYMKSMFRHFMAVWTTHRRCDNADIEEQLCALLFNVQGMLHEKLKTKQNIDDEGFTSEEIEAYEKELAACEEEAYAEKTLESFIETYIDAPVELAENRTCPVCGVPEGFAHKGWCETMQVQAKHTQCELCGGWGGAHTDNCENRSDKLRPGEPDPRD
mgnify:CR=1 FL=1